MYSKQFLQEQALEITTAINNIMMAEAISGEIWSSYELIKHLHKKRKELLKLLKKIKRAKEKRKRELEDEYIKQMQKMIELLLFYLKQENMQYLQNVHEAESLLAMTQSLFLTSSKLLLERYGYDIQQVEFAKQIEAKSITAKATTASTIQIEVVAEDVQQPRIEPLRSITKQPILRPQPVELPQLIVTNNTNKKKIKGSLKQFMSILPNKTYS